MSGGVPDLPSPRQCQSFDYRCRKAEQQRMAQGRCVEEARLRLATAVRQLNPARVKNTDVWGAMAATAEVLNGYSQSQKTVVIFSDLIDTVRLPVPQDLPGLVNAHILVRLVKNAPPMTVARHVAIFRDRVAQWGATVRVLSSDGPVNETLFMHAPNAEPLQATSQNRR